MVLRPPKALILYLPGLSMVDNDLSLSEMSWRDIYSVSFQNWRID